MPRPTLKEAQARFVHRYTMEHKPAWANKPADNGKRYAPQYRSDAEWYANTTFPGEPGLHGNCKYCETHNPSWPLGQWLA